MTRVTDTRILHTAVLKQALWAADTQDMIISDDQARIAAEYVRSRAVGDTPVAHGELSDELRLRLNDVLAAAPDTRQDRVDEARARICAGTCDSHEIASKMLARIISDAVR